MANLCSLPSTSLSIPIHPYQAVLSTRATVAYTLAAPARRSTRAHSEIVVPVVKTSSTSRMSRPRTALASRTANAPRIFSRRWCRVCRPACGTVSLWRTRHFVFNSPHHRLLPEGRPGDELGRFYPAAAACARAAAPEPRGQPFDFSTGSWPKVALKFSAKKIRRRKYAVVLQQMNSSRARHLRRRP